ncbi:ABC transporter ATP-binding protein [Clostridium algidicarnis]|uniref:ABC transporter ATP-binding protein n=1 Tax=Clostridium algidicarnis TaxID=37659 RepID=UPI001C0AAE90|nr:ABC transporter ATP-binding protein [Clostridium algidicarnis]MBU3195108.1 ABC transporter ATP-binding protein [Clostridium algidicarnis]MBU3208064.1 ABC transporter ATP-binding protein [Clostridium algidicarnis]MBU3227705.1 ABC transporter ATP-binding protein [Clostridium algidicarnis]MBU3250888.1 ABC transporter ATP-binding protein [Clostridium algidicarnis]
MLEIKDLKKSYGKFIALDGVSLNIKKGEIFGFVGPNGAGKTTTMKIVAGLLEADFGEVYVDGIDGMRENKKLKEKIGYMPDFFGVYENLKTIEYLEFYASIYGVVGKEAKKLSMDLLEIVNLKDKADFYVDGLSRGMKQRLCLARSLVHNPELLILDEPASGMDPRARYEMKSILKNLREMGKTILISSHILPELAELCTNIGIIEDGKMVVTSTVDEIMMKMNYAHPIKIKLLDKVEGGVKLLKELPYLNNLIVDNNNITVGFGGKEEEMVEVLKVLINNDIPVVSFAKESGNLEDIFMKITEKQHK